MKRTPEGAVAPTGFSGNELDGGVFTVSLDFELYWGMADLLDLDDEYRHLLDRTRTEVVPRLLDTFATNGIHATWATVGMLMFDSIEALLAGCPEVRPDYADPHLSAYRHLPPSGHNESHDDDLNNGHNNDQADDENTDPYRLGPSLIDRIQHTPFQEIGSHSFSHFYCLEPNAEPTSFLADLRAWSEAASRHDVEPTSICFGRNQYDDAALAACNEIGFRAVRGNERSWFWQPRAAADDPFARKLVRNLDAYLPLSRSTCLSLAEIAATTPHDVAASRFLRAHNPKLRRLEPLKMRRTTRMMTEAAQRRRVFHLWWHPQDFAVDTEANFRTLDQILDAYHRLRDHHGMVSLNMGEVAELASPSEFAGGPLSRPGGAAR